MSVETAIQNLLDTFGINLDADSFHNLILHTRVSTLPWSARTALAVALGVLVQYARKRMAAAREAALASQEVTV